MSGPSPAATPAPPTPETLERWAVARIIGTTKHPNGAALVGALRHEGTRALRGRPFTFSFSEEGAEGATIILHGTITGVMIGDAMVADRAHFGSVALKTIALMSLLIGGQGPVLIVYGQRQGRNRRKWTITNYPDTRGSRQAPTGTLEIG